jgi:hypothetical protein
MTEKTANEMEFFSREMDIFYDSYDRMRLAINIMEECDRYALKHNVAFSNDVHVQAVYIQARGILLKEFNIPNPERLYDPET